MIKILAYVITCITFVVSLNMALEYRKFLHGLGKFYYEINRPNKPELTHGTVVGEWMCCSGVENGYNIVYNNRYWGSCKE
jgi:hypothetical protein